MSYMQRRQGKPQQTPKLIQRHSILMSSLKEGVWTVDTPEGHLLLEL